ncbi:MAG: DNA polymerase [Terrimicrobiaceae bacterium]
MADDLRDELKTPNLNLASPEQLLSALKGIGLNLPNTSKETLSAIPHPIAALVVKYRGLVGLCNTMQGWLKCLDSSNRLYPPLNPLGADTGRFSCKKPNLLATPRDSEIRCCLIPDDGFALIEADFSNIEMRIAAWFAREERMLAIFRDGGDIHGETAALVLGDRQARQPAKPINFGCLYGGGAERLRITARTDYGIEFSSEQARRHHNQVFTIYRGLPRWHRSAKASAPGLTYGTTPYGRRRWADPADSKDAWNWNRFQLATNFPVQGTGADAIKLALVRLHRELAGTDARILLQVHDSILVQAPRESAHAVKDLVRQAMCGAFYEILGPDFPVAVNTSISERWGQKS